MSILPRGTLLGFLSFFEIYDDFYGPKCFSVKNDLDQLYLVYWSGDYDDCSKWIYMPVSQKILDELVREEVSFFKSFKESKRLMIVTTCRLSSSGYPHVALLTDDNKHSVNLPPVDFCLEPESIQGIAPESCWDFNLRIAKKSGKSNPDRGVVSKILDAFCEIIESLMNDDSQRIPKVFPLTATYGSFDVKLGTSNHERASVAVEQLGALLADVESAEEKLSNLSLDPYRLKDLLDIVNLHKLELTLKPKTSELLQKAVTINADRLLPIILKLEESTVTFIDSNKVPQANDLDRVIEVVQLRLDGKKLKHEDIEGINSERQVSYYVNAAWCLGLLNKNKTVSSPGRVLCKKASMVAKYQYLAERMESSDFGWAWMKWAKVDSLAELDPSSAEAFIRECVNGLNRDTIPRRSNSLSTWLSTLQEHARVYSDI
jgi:hypothetical protein